MTANEAQARLALAEGLARQDEIRRLGAQLQQRPDLDVADWLLAAGRLTPATIGPFRRRAASATTSSPAPAPAPTTASGAVAAPPVSNPNHRTTRPDSRSGDSGDGLRVEPTLADFEILRTLGEGGMGRVVEARRRSDGRLFALKQLTKSEEGSSGLARFEREARAMARLDHPSILKVHDVVLESETPFMVIDLAPGGSLADRLESGPLAPEEALELGRDLAQALQRAHERGIIHRDIKPQNVLFGADGRPLLSDFGLARALDGSGDDFRDGAARLTRDGAILGTLAYMPPEQVEGDRARITEAADIYALGATLYESVTGRIPFRESSTQELMAAILFREVDRPRSLRPELSRDFETLLLRCLAKAPEDRYASAAELARDCDRALHGEPIKARPLSLLERLERRRRRHAGALLAGSLLFAALVVAALLGLGLHLRARARRETIALAALREARAARDQALVDQRRARNAARLAKASRADARAALEAKEAARRKAAEAKAGAARRVELARAAATRARRRFTGIRSLAKALLFEFHDDVAKLQGSTEIRERLVRESRRFLDRLATDNRDDVALRFDLARAWRRIGDVLGGSRDAHLGRSAEAIKAYERARTFLDSVLAAPKSPETGSEPDPARLEDLILRVHCARALQRELRREKASEVLRPALKPLSHLWRDHPGKKVIGLEFVRAAQLAAELGMRRRLSARQATQLDQICVKAMQGLRAAHRDDLTIAIDLQRARFMVGFQRLQRSKQATLPKEAVLEMIKAQRTLDKYAKAHPESFEAQLTATEVVSRLALFFLQEHQEEAGIKLLEQARERLTRAVESNPRNVVLRHALVLMKNGLLLGHAMTDHKSSLKPAIRALRRDLKALAEGSRVSLETRSQVVISHGSIAKVSFISLGDFDGALGELRRAANLALLGRPLPDPPPTGKTSRVAVDASVWMAAAFYLEACDAQRRGHKEAMASRLTEARRWYAEALRGADTAANRKALAACDRALELHRKGQPIPEVMP